MPSYTIQRLIDALKNLPSHATVYVWDDGDRHAILSVDKVDETTVDLNINAIDSTEELSRLQRQLDDLRKVARLNLQLTGINKK